MLSHYARRDRGGRRQTGGKLPQLEVDRSSPTLVSSPKGRAPQQWYRLGSYLVSFDKTVVSL
jgi:hypothetical protein